MSRRSGRKVDILPSDPKVDVVSKPAAAEKVGKKSPRKKDRTPVNEERVVITATSVKSEVVQAKRAENSEATNSVTETLVVIEADKSPGKRRIKNEGIKNHISTESRESPTKVKAKPKREAEIGGEGDEEVDVQKIKKRRKTKEEKEAEAMPLATRTSVQTLKRAMYIGAHVSGAGGVHNSINNAVHIGGNAFALFLKSQRKWVSPPLAKESQDLFHAFSNEHKYDQSKHVLPHGSYLVNLAQAEPEKAQQAYDCFLDDLQRCEALGIKLYNFHPGNTGPHPRLQAIARIAANLNKAHKATKSVVTLLENMAGSGNVIGSTFEDLRDIIDLIEDKSRIGVCIDTCHSFAAGYDLRTPEAFKKTMGSFSDIIGLKFLKALHLNDSKAPFSSHRDLHANIGTGFLGLRAFHNVVNFEPFQHLPMVLETPIDKKGEDGKVIEDKSIWAAEIKLLESLIGADPESDEFKADELRLQELGAEERAKFQKQADKKVQKTIDSMFKSPKGRRKKKGEAEDEGSDSDGDDEGGCSH